MVENCSQIYSPTQRLIVAYISRPKFVSLVRFGLRSLIDVYILVWQCNGCVVFQTSHTYMVIGINVEHATAAGSLPF